MPQSENISSSPTSLKIVTRVKPKKDQSQEPQEFHSVYHWDRIIGVIALLFISIIVLIYFAISSLISTNEQNTNTITKPTIVVEPSNTTVTTTSVKLAATAPSASNETPLIPMDSKTESLISQANTALSTSSPGAGTHSLNPPIVTIYSDNINRAIFTHTLKNKEPNSIINDIVTLDEGGLSRVYFFTDIKNRAGDTFTHTWYRNGKKIVKVRTPIGSDEWRCSSSKYLDKNMEGDWEVKVTDKKGELVASGSFAFTKG
ncbi:hypothetical protein A9Q81_00970 [Gammaproteobacteria bacterium 42_54_T18]|nr:hypothetical protein A9Q81_00970 [Gammaproteobacteria bacterium 42_54_T18]